MLLIQFLGTIKLKVSTSIQVRQLLPSVMLLLQVELLHLFVVLQTSVLNLKIKLTLTISCIHVSLPWYSKVVLMDGTFTESSELILTDSNSEHQVTYKELTYLKDIQQLQVRVPSRELWWLITLRTSQILTTTHTFLVSCRSTILNQLTSTYLQQEVLTT